jgi:ppGpp synthetase/RelA/SpoT-type nucleotidyltranferase
MAPLIKINLGKQLCYFNEAEDESVKWATRGLPIEYINLREDLKFKKGGQVDYSREMIKSQNKEIAHHSSELSSVLDKYKKMSVEPWVIAKLERATTDLSDVTHYLDGKEGKDYYAKGGSVGEWTKATTIKFKTRKEALQRLNLLKGDDTKEYRNLRVENDNYGDKLNDGYRVVFEYLKRPSEYAKGGSTESNILSKEMFINMLTKGNGQIQYVNNKLVQGRLGGENYRQKIQVKGFFLYDENAKEGEKIKRFEDKADGYGLNVKYYKNFDLAYKTYLSIVNKNTDTAFAKGGDIPVKIVNKGKTYDKSNYKAIYGDFDKDGLMNSDDPNPIKKGDKRRVEQLSFPKIFDTLLDTKGKLDSTMYDAVATLKKITPDGGKIYARTKTPYSIINKLIDSRMIVPKDPKKGLTDMVGTTIVVDSVEDVMRVQKEIESGALGEILPEGYDKNGNVILADDKYKNPKGGYRAIHYIVIMDGIPVEVQLKTMRMKEINELAHPHYKAKNLNSDYMNYLTDLADKGDRGDVKAQREFNSIMRNKKNVSEKLKLDSTYMYAMGGRVEEIYGDEMDLDGIFEDFKED